jgi:hypothetical protein
MYPWMNPNFHGPKDIPPKSKYFLKEFEWNYVKGDGLSWNDDEPGVYKIIDKKAEANEYQWATMIFYCKADLKQMKRLGWKLLDVDWWILKPISASIRWGEISRKALTSLHIPNVIQFQKDIHLHLTNYLPDKNKYQSLPRDPYGKTIWHHIWSIWLTDTPPHDDTRIVMHNIAMQKFPLSTLHYTDCFGNTWLHEAAKHISSQKGWNDALKLAKHTWENKFPQNLQCETPLDILQKRNFTTNSHSSPTCGVF